MDRKLLIPSHASDSPPLLRARSQLLESTQVIEIEQPLTAIRSSIPSLRANFAWTFAGNVLYGACQWGMLSVLAKLGSASVVGQFTLGLAVSAPVFMFTNLQLRVVQATDVSAETKFANYFTLRLLATLFGLMLVVALLPFAGASFAVRLVILLVSVSKCVECMSDVTAGLLQREEQLRRVAVSLMMRGGGSVLVFFLTFAYFRNLALSVAAMCGVWLAVLLYYDVRNVRALIGRHDPFFRFDGHELWRLAMLGLPLGWVATFASLNVNIPRYFLEHYLGLAEQGTYASLAYLVVAINLVVAALSVSVTTHLARLFAEGDHRQFVRLLTKLSILGVLIAAVGVPLTFLVGRQLLTMLYRPEYAAHVGLLGLFVGIASVSTIGSFLFCGLTAARSFRMQVPVYFGAMLIAIVGAALLVPRYGLIGAGIAPLLSAMAIVLGGLWMMREALRSGLARAARRA
jgi:O-antigen/teichoic acid export membrane protein